MHDATMQKLTATDPETHSTELVAENLAVLKELFPELITEGADGVAVNIDVLKALVGDKTVSDADEKYGLNWHGKRRARQLALTPSTGTLRPCPVDSVDWDTTQNLMIEGDNLEVLKLLQKSYAGKVKLIYIDPPYNTGKDFVYPDDYRDSIRNYFEVTGQASGGRKISTNVESTGRFHTNWISMMYPRMKVARSLLHPDGVLFASIDDSEVDNMRRILDDIFGEERRLGMIAVVSNLKGRSDDKYFATAHNYLLAYGGIAYASRGVPLPEEYFNDYPEIAADGRRYRLQGLRKRGAGARRIDRPNMYYPLYVDPKTRSVETHLANNNMIEVLPALSDGTEGRWRWGKDTARERASDLVAQKVGPDQRWDIFQIDFAESLEGVKRITPKTIWSGSEFANEAGTLELKKLFTKAPFDTAKPLGLLRYCIEQAATDECIILDFFAGSGTAGHAVYQANAEIGGNRRFILVQLPEPLDPNNISQKAASDECDSLERARNIAELTKERLRRSASKVRKENPLFAGDLGFRVFKLDSTNILEWDPDRDKIAENLEASIEHLKTDRTEQDILFELLLKLGLDLCVPIETKTVEGSANQAHSLHSIGGGSLLVCLSQSIPQADVEPLALALVAWHQELSPAGDTTVVFRDSAFADDVAKTNMTANLQQHGLETVKSL